jgi:uncharacterized membrane protein YbhN (UPF0104 family)
MKKPNWQSQILSALLTVGALGLLTRQLIRGYHSLPTGFFQNIKVAPLAGSLIVLILALLFVSLRWGFTLHAMGVSVGLWSAAKIWFLSQAGRYAPGGIWNYVARFYLGRTEIPDGTVITSMILETGLRVVSEILVFLLSIPFWPQRKFLSANTVFFVFLLVGGVALGLVLLHPNLLQRFANLWVMRRIGLKAVDFSGFRYVAMLGLLFYYILSVAIVGLAFFIFVSALYPVSASFLPYLTGSLAVSVVLGFLFPLVPNGWGVREGILTFLLAQSLPVPVSIVIAMASRIWLTAGETFWIIIMLGLHWKERRNNP